MPINIIKPDNRKPGKRGLPGKRGEKGERGERGIQGVQGIAGKDGLNGINGRDGIDGKDGSRWYDGKGAPDANLGVSGDFYLDNDTYDYYEKTTRWVKRGNLKGAKGDKGERGPRGEKGQDGGVGSPGADGAQGPQGPQGMQGAQGDPGVGVPAGGTTGQVLAKDSDTDYDTEWVDQSGAVAIGDTVSGSNANRLLYMDNNNELSDDGLIYRETLVAGFIPFFEQQPHEWGSSDPTFGYADLSVIGQPKAVIVSTQGGSGSFLMSTGSSSIFLANENVFSIGVQLQLTEVPTTVRFDGGSGAQPILIDFAAGSGSTNYFIGKTAGASSFTGKSSFAFTAGPTRSFLWQDYNGGSYLPLMELAVDTAALYIKSLDTGGAAPTTSGTTKMVISDSNGMLSFDDIPSGVDLETDGTPNGDQTLLNLISGTNITLTDNGTGGVTIDAAGGSPGGSDTQIQFNDGGSFAGDDDFWWVNDADEKRLIIRRDSSTQTVPMFQIIKDSNNQTLLKFSTPNAAATSELAWFAPGNSTYGMAFRATSGATSGWNFEAGNSGMFLFGTLNSVTALWIQDDAKIALGAWNFSTQRGWVSLHGGDANSVTTAVVNAASQAVDSFRVVNNSGTTQFAIAKNGAIKPPSLADSAAENNTIFIGSDHSNKLCFKDGSGVVNELY